jgi:hypothetical protein
VNRFGETYLHDPWSSKAKGLKMPISKELEDKLTHHDEVIEVVKFENFPLCNSCRVPKLINGTSQLERLRGKLEMLGFEDPDLPNYFPAFYAILDEDEIPEEVWGLSTFYHWPNTVCFKIL